MRLGLDPLFEHDFVRKPVATPGSSPGAGIFGIMHRAGDLGALSPVMPGLVPGIHVFLPGSLEARRGWPERLTSRRRYAPFVRP